MSNYPPGTGPNDPRAPWNAPEPPECWECENHIVEPEDHAEGCESGHMDATDIIDADEAAAQELRFEQRRLEERSP